MDRNCFTHARIRRRSCPRHRHCRPRFRPRYHSPWPTSSISTRQGTRTHTRKDKNTPCKGHPQKKKQSRSWRHYMSFLAWYLPFTTINGIAMWDGYKIITMSSANCAIYHWPFLSKHFLLSRQILRRMYLLSNNNDNVLIVRKCNLSQ